MKNFENSIMRGEFRGDFTRDTFQPEKTYSRVLLQQGRVQLDADWNEQVSITLHHLRNLACDLAGPHWGPTEGNGFAITLNESKDFLIGAGHYYVDGILCEAGDGVTYFNQPHVPQPDIYETPDQQQALLVYLDVWERHISALEDDAIREVALGGPDTASRAQIVWQVKTLLLPAGNVIGGDSVSHPFKESYEAFLAAIADIVKPGQGRLAAKAKDRAKTDTEPCLVEPKARYRGAENQLYRVEIHTSSNSDQAGTFKWSRENASVAFPIVERNESGDNVILTLEHLGRDERLGLKPDDWVEVLDDDAVLSGNSDNLLRIVSIDAENRQVTLNGFPSTSAGTYPAKHPYLRRWDQKNGDADGIPIQLGFGDDVKWIDLEDGIQVSFPADKNENENGAYRVGDYWLIPARQITGDVEWPEQDGNPKALLPHGVQHHYAPLAIIARPRTSGPQGDQITFTDLRRILTRIWK